MTFNIVGLKERIAISPDYSEEERTFILDAVNVRAAGKPEYPSRHGPETSLWAKFAWAVLDDNVPPDWLKREQRLFLAGVLAGAMHELYLRAKRETMQ